MQKILINGQWTPSLDAKSSFHAFNPATKEPLEDRLFPVSGSKDIEALVEAGHRAAGELRSCQPERIADFLETYAKRIEENADELARVANLETGLPVNPRLATVEIPRTVNQLRQAAQAARRGDWARPTIDTANNIRSLHGPLGGPVVVFGPNNFPFAFNGISGGDFAAAIAAGNPVIAKAHPAHPYTSQLLAEEALHALRANDLPPAAVQLFYHADNEEGLTLARHPQVAALAFTGSRGAGLALKQAADQVGKPIYLEMSSVNPVFILPGALVERSDAIAEELQGSCSLGAGQFCTKPGLAVLIESEEATRFAETLRERFLNSSPGILFTASGVDAVSKSVGRLTSAGAETLTGGATPDTPQFAYEPTLLRVSGDQFLADSKTLQSEAFGVVCLLVIAKDLQQCQQIAAELEGNLTIGLFSDTAGSDDDAYQSLEPILRPKAGRLLNDKMPTGVAVSPAMNHGGPYPATGHPVFTAVGFPASITRFSALHCYDNVRQHRLPPPLQDKNPTGSTLRLVDGEWTTADVSSK